jgi:hypothetical protein
MTAIHTRNTLPQFAAMTAIHCAMQNCNTTPPAFHPVISRNDFDDCNSFRNACPSLTSLVMNHDS